MDKLIQTKVPKTGDTPDGELSAVDRAYDNMSKLAKNEEGAGKRAPLEVLDNGDGTYSVIDGNATLAVARNQGWKELPVAIHPADVSDVEKQ